MDSKLIEVPQPLNPQERMMYAQIQRLDALCHMLSDLVATYGKVNGLGVEEVVSVEQAPKKTSTTKSTKGKTTTPRKPRAKTTKKQETTVKE